jgi:hypothetical protein
LISDATGTKGSERRMASIASRVADGGWSDDCRT